MANAKGSAMDAKAELRRVVLARREAETDRARKSAAIMDRLAGHAAFRSARHVAWYVGVGSEVATLPAIERALGRGVAVSVPAVSPAGLKLYEITSLGELAPAPFGLLEPDVTTRAGREVRTEAVDLFVVPGVAFDLKGGRLGHGKAYYDRLLAAAPPSTPRVAVAFECQLVERVPMGSHDQFMHLLITESRAEEFHAGRREK